jgi:uncharacterized FlaG/YvyC family protein
LIPKPDKDTTKKEYYRPIFLMIVGAKIFHKIISKQTKQYTNKITHHDQVGLIGRIKGWFTICTSINVIYHINRKTDHMIISIAAKNTGQIIESIYLNIMKAI